MYMYVLLSRCKTHLKIFWKALCISLQKSKIAGQSPKLFCFPQFFQKTAVVLT